MDNLIGLSNAQDSYSQPTHLRTSSTNSTSSNSPTASMVALPTLPARPSSTTHSVPIPRPLAASRRTQTLGASVSFTESPLSPSSVDSASASPDLSPVLSALPASYASGATHLTTPASSASLRETPPAPYGTPGAGAAVMGLSYPSVPPPSLSSSLGSPVVMTHIPSPGPGPRHGHLSERRFSHGQGSRRTSVERGARIAETGSLARSRAGSGASGSLPSAGANAGGEHLTFVPSLLETRESE